MGGMGGGPWDLYVKGEIGWGGQVFDSAIFNYTSILAIPSSFRY